jgi:hypothetical protein
VSRLPRGHGGGRARATITFASTFGDRFPASETY